MKRLKENKILKFFQKFQKYDNFYMSDHNYFKLIPKENYKNKVNKNNKMYWKLAFLCLDNFNNNYLYEYNYVLKLIKSIGEKYTDIESLKSEIWECFFEEECENI